MNRSSTLAHQPALDGVRAVAVALVLLFHGGATFVRGGYVGVSVFFTLSGFLITTLLLVEHDRTDRVAVGAFYARRVKRLLPASMLCLVGTTVLWRAGWLPADASAFRRDLLGSVFQVFNWVKLTGHVSYAQLIDATLGRVGPLEHYWSLAIEEQFYWVWPVTMALLLRRVESRGARAAVLVAAAVVAAVVAPVVAHVWGSDAAYWATPARAGEILVGAAAAALLRWRPVTSGRVAWAVPAGAAVVLRAATRWPPDRGPAYEGWLPVFALATAAVLVGLQVPSRWRTALSARALVWLGGVSYGVYLYHWPLFALLTAERVGVGGVALFALRVLSTLTLAGVSMRWVEAPIRRWSPVWPRALALGGAVTVVAALATVVAVRPDGGDGDVAAAAGAAAAAIVPVTGELAPLAPVTSAPPSSSTSRPASEATDQPASTPTAATIGPTSVPVPTRPVRVLVLGDSTAQHTAIGLVSYALDHPDVLQVTDASLPGCGFLREGVVPTDGDIDWAGPCDAVLDRLPQTIDELRPDVVLLMVTMRDVEDRIFDGDDRVVSALEPAFAARLADAYGALAAQLAGLGVAHVAWVLPPNPIAPFQGEQRKMLDPARYEVQFDVIRAIAAERPDLVGVLDMAGWLDDQGASRDGAWRPDGLHWSDEASRRVADAYLVPSLVSLALS